jgi:hypothetical protein
MNSSDSDDLAEEFLTDDTQNFLSQGEYVANKYNRSNFDLLLYYLVF